ncbi:hypothetical protein FXB41_07120 [Bradyrhizobium canariense]|uniref:helix-turn-helix domain-containing protein n=1 Tax=Bradyrhizobium canariense TaxID=255045 RepID=UPI001CA476E0|nr:helix-turn-helix domain-containing protein [Bradyrhizobium canariense]MBW5434555.1 hypothetical protein [Bradyrhizobium canariense]
MAEKADIGALADLERQHSEERIALFSRHALERAAILAHAREFLRDDASMRPDLGLKDLIPSGEAADLVKRAKSTMSKWCRDNRIEGERGFARQIGKRWFVSKSRLRRHLTSISSD